jgi:hypothetical protein
MLVAAACGDTGDTTTTEAPTTAPPATEPETTEAPAETEPETTEAPASTEAPTELEVLAAPTQDTCYYVKGLLVAPEGAPIVDPRVILVTDIDGVLTSLAEALPAAEAFGTEIDAYVDVYRIDNGSDPLALAAAIGNGAGPVYVMAPAPHWSFAPGEDTNAAGVSVDDAVFVDATPLADPPNTHVAVVDTGYEAAPDDAAGDWSWLESGVVGLDGDPDGGGHGTFVASIIRQVSPASQVVVARAHTIDKNQIVLPDGHTEAPDSVTSSLHVANAIERLKDHAVRGGFTNYDVWNLSLGTYKCELAEPVVDVVNALGEVSGIKVAAGGNENMAADFWPAAGDGIFGIDAMTTGNEVVLWNENMDRLEGAANALQGGHAYADPVPGIDLIGTIGNGQVVSWSGSSFAAAVASGLFASGADPANSPPVYAEVPFLRYVDEGIIYNDPARGPVELP